MLSATTSSGPPPAAVRIPPSPRPAPPPIRKASAQAAPGIMWSPRSMPPVRVPTPPRSRARSHSGCSRRRATPAAWTFPTVGPSESFRRRVIPFSRLTKVTSHWKSIMVPFCGTVRFLRSWDELLIVPHPARGFWYLQQECATMNGCSSSGGALVVVPDAGGHGGRRRFSGRQTPPLGVWLEGSWERAGLEDEIDGELLALLVIGDE